MEEDIKILEEFANIVKGKDYNAQNGWHGYYDDELIVLGKAIQNLIKRNHYLENAVRKTVNQELDKAKIELYKDYIPKSKVKEKIEELLKKLDEPNNDRWERNDDIYYNKIKAQIRILQELMEDK